MASYAQYSRHQVVDFTAEVQHMVYDSDGAGKTTYATAGQRAAGGGAPSTSSSSVLSSLALRKLALEKLVLSPLSGR